MLLNTLLLALRAIRRNLLRSFLTILGIVIGVAAVITMVTVGNGATRSIQDQISSMGSNLLMVRPGQRMGSSGGVPNFKESDAEAIRMQISGLEAVAPTTNRGAVAVSMSRNWSTSVTGTNEEWFRAGNWDIAIGRVFNETEERSGKTVCVIGETVRRELFGSRNPVGELIRIKQFSCEVVGVMASKGQSAMGRDQDDVIVMPLRTVQRRLTGSQDVHLLMISVQQGGSLSRATEQIRSLMRERRKISSGEDDNFFVMDTRQIAEALTGTTRIMTALLGAVAAVSLLVGGIGIMNIMLVSVTERTREIGIRLAIGALEHEVLLQFLIEATVLAALGGVVGVALATVASAALTRMLQVPFLFDPGINVISFVFSAGIGAAFGYFPARRAAGLDPIEALRHE
ncbi:MAG: ABC transporter permease [Syntrophorhabdaceae bacterium]|nr:ABC transporter permease [Syntrophorhabdaceae bacterium]